jgi:hypothetical protein
MPQTQFNYIKGLIAFICIVILNFIFWRIFFAPTHSIFKLFTPMYGLSLIATLFFIYLAIVDIFEVSFESKNNLGKGVLITIAAVIVLYILYYGFFWNFLGKYGVTYFSPKSIIKAGGTGAEMWNARENSSLAILYVMTAYIWITISWNVGFGNLPCEQESKARKGLAKFFAISFFSIIAYALLFHPHVTALFVPKQIYAGVLPWWEEKAMTSSALYHLGWIFSAIMILIFCEETLEGWPWKNIKSMFKNRLVSGVIIIAISIIVGFVFFNILESIMNYYWDEPFTGGNYTDDPRFRHIHVAEIAGFYLFAIYILKVFFNNFPVKFSKLVNNIIRFIIVGVGGMLIWWFYYSPNIGPKYVDRVSGIGSITDTSLCWTIMSILIILFYDKFFNAFPLRK